MTGGAFYRDSILPFSAGAQTSVTLSTSSKRIAPNDAFPQLGGYFNYVGRALRVRISGKYTTGATPGNLSFSPLWGPGVDNSGTNLGGVSLTGVVNLTDYSFFYEATVRCRALGASGSLLAQGLVWFQNTALGLCPPASPAAVTVDLTQNYYIQPQILRSGSTTETIQVLDIFFESLN